MKVLFLITLAVILGLFALGISSCATTVTRLPDGTVIESRAPAIKSDTKRFAADVIRAWSPRPIQPRREK